MAYLKGGHVLEKDMSYRTMIFCKTNFKGRICLTGGHILQENMYYWRMHLTGEHELLEYIFYL